MKVKVRVSMEVDVELGRGETEAHALEYVSYLLSSPLRTHHNERIMEILARPPATWTKEMAKAAIKHHERDGKIVNALLDGAKWEAGKVKRSW